MNRKIGKNPRKLTEEIMMANKCIKSWANGRIIEIF